MSFIFKNMSVYISHYVEQFGIKYKHYEYINCIAHSIKWFIGSIIYFITIIAKVLFYLHLNRNLKNSTDSVN